MKKTIKLKWEKNDDFLFEEMYDEAERISAKVTFYQSLEGFVEDKDDFLDGDYELDVLPVFRGDKAVVVGRWAYSDGGDYTIAYRGDSIKEAKAATLKSIIEYFSTNEGETYATE